MAKSEKRFKIALIFGTRPEIIKLSPLMRLFRKKRVPYFMVHTGQHYSPELDAIFFKDLKLPQPKYCLRLRSRAAHLQGAHTGRMMARLEEVMLKENPSHVLVQGDTNTVLAGALAASKLSTAHLSTGRHYTLGHVEAGLRSFDRRMPEEINRFVADHLSDLCFAPSPAAGEQLKKEGVAPEKIHLTGNTIVDAVMQNIEIARSREKRMALPGHAAGDYILATLHRQENVDHPGRLDGILDGIRRASRALSLPVILPVHPRTKARIKQFGLRVPEQVQMVAPVGFLEFLILESRAKLVMTDSGGVQEESCILHVPCVTLRTSTERPETVQAGANTVAGIRPKDIERCAVRMSRTAWRWKNPFGDGHAAERILNLIYGIPARKSP